MDIKPTELAERAGISVPYASQILSKSKNRRTPRRSLAIHIYRKTGWRHESISDLTEKQMRVFEEVEPWERVA